MALHPDVAKLDYTVGNINVSGLEVTNLAFVTQQLAPIKDAKTFGGVVDAVNNSILKCKGLDVFNDVEVTFDSSDKSVVDLDFVFQEKRRHAITAGVVVVGPKAMVETKAKLRNVFGNGESLLLNGDIGQLIGGWGHGTVGNAKVTLDKPSLFGGDDSLNLSLSHATEKCENVMGYNTSNIVAGATVFGERLGAHHTLGLSVRHSSLSWGDGSLSGNTSAFKPGTEVFSSSLKHEVTWDNRETGSIPGPGQALRISNELCVPVGPYLNTLPGNLDQESYKFHKMQVQFRQVSLLAPLITLHTDFNAGFMNSLVKNKPDIYAPDRFYLGGPWPLRGFAHAALGRTMEESKEDAAQEKKNSRGHTVGGTSFLTASMMLRYALPSSWGVLHNLNAQAQAFVNAGSLNKGQEGKGMESKDVVSTLFKELRPTVGVGLVFPMSESGRIEANFSMPMGATLDQNVEWFQIGMIVDWM